MAGNIASMLYFVVQKHRRCPRLSGFDIGCVRCEVCGVKCPQRTGVRFLEERCEVFGKMGKWSETVLLGSRLWSRNFVGVSPMPGFDI